MRKIPHTIVARSLLSVSSVLIFTTCTPTKQESTHAETHLDDSKQAHEITLTKAQQKEAGIILGSFTYAELRESIDVNGVIDLPPNNIASISAKEQGFIKNINYIVGDKVNKGEVLAVLEHPIYIQLQQDYVAAFSQFKYKEKDIKRQEKLFEKQAIAKKSWEKTQADFMTTRAAMQALRKHLKLLGLSPTQAIQGNIQASVRLFSPFGGTISKLHAHKGQWVAAGTAIMEVIDNDHMHIELQVFQKHFPYLQEQMPVTFRVPAFDKDTTYHGTVAVIGKRIDLETKTVQVHAHFDTTSEIVPGLYVEAKLWGKAAIKRVLTAESILKDAESQYFFVKESSRCF